ncbi:MAG: VWA domain-containing protein [Gammaproteobacteria bacterium]|nr:VWA domain-containing protein [Gammaproteobacteria bacterium]
MLQQKFNEEPPPGYEYKEEDQIYANKKEHCHEVLSDMGLEKHKTQVVFVLDISGSMDAEIKAGHIDSFVKKIALLAGELDDDQRLQIFSFGTTVSDVVLELNLQNPHEVMNFSVREDILNKINPAEVAQIRDGTNYAPVLNEIMKRYYPETKQSPLKKIHRDASKGVFVIFLTDGDCHDKKASSEAVIQSSYCGGLFIKFVGIDIAKEQNKKGFRFLEGLDDMAVSSGCGRFFNASTRYIDNVDFLKCKPSEVENLPYEELLREYVPFLSQSAQKNLLRNPGLTEDAQYASIRDQGRTTEKCVIL